MFNLHKADLRYTLTRSVVEDTLRFIRQQAAQRHEGAVLWAGRVLDEGVRIEEAIVPRQVASTYRFDIPDAEVFRVLGYIAERGLIIPVQVHSHPGEECHSFADDAGALVQHEGGISIVVPHFGDFPDDEFLHRVLTYRLTAEGDWTRIATTPLFEIHP